MKTQLCIRGIFVLLVALHCCCAVQVHLPDVIKCIGAVAQPYIESRAAADEYKQKATDELMVAIESIPEMLDVAHKALAASAMKAAGQSHRVIGSVSGLGKALAGLATTLEDTRTSCQSNMFTVDTDKLTKSEHSAAHAIADLPTPHLDPTALLAAVKDVQEDHSLAMGADEAAVQEAQQFLQPSEGSDLIAEKILGKYGEDATVSLKDVLSAIQIISAKVEDARLNNLSGALTKFGDASAYMGASVKHASGLRNLAQILHGMVSNMSNSRLPVMEQIANVINHDLGAIQCI